MSDTPIPSDDVQELRRRARLNQLRLKIARQNEALSALRRSGHRDSLESFYDPANYFDPRDYLFETARFGGAIPTTRNDRDEGRNYPIFRTEQELALIRGAARLLTSSNPIAVGVLASLTNYVIGNGFHYTTNPRRVSAGPLAATANAVIDEFLCENDWSGDLDRELFQRSRIDGEYFLGLWHVGQGHVQARAIEPDQVTEPTNKSGIEEWLGCSGNRRSGLWPDAPSTSGQRPDLKDAEFVSNWNFGVHTHEDDAQAIHGYYVQWSNRDTDWDYFPGGNEPIVPPDGAGTWVEHAKLNVVRSVKRGLSDFFPIDGTLELARRVLRNMGEGSAVQAAIAWIQEVAPGTTQSQVHTGTLSRADGSYTTLTQQGASRTHYVQQYDPATILKVPSGQKYLPGPLGSQHAPNFITAAEALLRTVALRWSLPENLITGSAANNNFASSLVAETPFVKYAESQQQFYAQRDRKTLWRVLWFAWSAGRFGDVPWTTLQQTLEITVTPPQIEVRDPEKETRVRQMLHEAGMLSRKTWSAQESLDFDQEQKNLKAEGAEAGSAPADAQTAEKPAGNFGEAARAAAEPAGEVPRHSDSTRASNDDESNNETTESMEGTWDATKHPRGGHLKNRGWFSRVFGGKGLLRGKFGRDRSNATARIISPSDKDYQTPLSVPGSARVFLAAMPKKKIPPPGKKSNASPPKKPNAPPSSSRQQPKPGDYDAAHRTPREGWGDGTRGTGNWAPEEPLTLPNGKKVKSIPYDSDGMPILDKWSEGDVTIALTGVDAIDRDNAAKALGKEAPNGYTFHHDARSMKVVKIDGKDVLVGRMQLVPSVLNDKAKHVGSRRVADSLYAKAGRKREEVIKTMNDLNSQLRNGKGPLAKAVENMPSGKIANTLKRHLGKTVKRIIPVIGGALTLLDFNDEAEAHGLPGAIARATPMLGDLIALHDATQDLANQMIDRANRAAADSLDKANVNPAIAQQTANAQAVATFNRLAADIKVTNPYMNLGKIADAIRGFREEVAAATLLQLEGKPIATDAQRDDPQLSPYNNRIKQAEERLRKKLEAEAGGAQRGTPAAARDFH